MIETFQQIKTKVGQLWNRLESDPSIDRAETKLCGFHLRAWRTKINCAVKLHIGYKSPWEKTYYESTVENLPEMLVKYKGSDDKDYPIEV